MNNVMNGISELIAPTATVSTAPRGKAVRVCIFFVLCATLMMGPLALGAVEPWSIALMELGAAVLLLLWAFYRYVRGTVRAPATGAWGPVALLATVVVIQRLFGWTAVPYATAEESMQYAAYAVFMLAAVASIRGRWARRFVIAFALYGAGVAFFGIIQSFTTKDLVYWTIAPQNPGWVFGPYVNHNHYAGLMELLMPFALVLALRRDIPPPIKFASFAAVAVMGTSVVLSGSRGGLIAVGVQALLVLFLPHILPKGKKTAATVIVVVMLVLLAWLGTEQVWNRVMSLGTSGPELAMRWLYVRDSMPMVARHPLLGWGLGTFPDVFSQFQTFYSTVFVNATHNDYVQFLVETGIAGLVALLWLIFAALRGATRALRRLTTDEGMLSVAAGWAVVGIAIHSFFDFNLQIPANAALFYVLCSLAARPLYRPRNVSNLAELWESAGPE
jgi:O-antigen ligase